MNLTPELMQTDTPWVAVYTSLTVDSEKVMTESTAY